MLYSRQRRPKLLSYLKEKGIHATAYSCLGSTDSPLYKNEELKKLAPLAKFKKLHREAAGPFGQSIEAKEGVDTGISAADRARTVSVAIDASKGADDIVTPGHVFPLVAREGGVLVRAGHTEAAVDIARRIEASVALCAALALPAVA